MSHFLYLVTLNFILSVKKKNKNTDKFKLDICTQLLMRIGSDDARP